MSHERFYMNTLIDRVWHAAHALGILMLVLSGFNIHYAESFNVLGSMERAVRFHNVVGVVVCIDWGIWLLYNFFSSRFRFYLPGRDELPAGVLKQVNFYLRGILRGEERPFPATPERKFNPLQKWAYLGVMFIVVPFQIATGIIMLWAVTNAERLAENKMFFLSVSHTVAAFFSAIFVIAHIYLATTGKKPTTYFKLMITGWHDPE
jgi:thiosulfate reductase cytochrome b subunit